MLAGERAHNIEANEPIRLGTACIQGRFQHNILSIIKRSRTTTPSSPRRSPPTFDFEKRKKAAGANKSDVRRYLEKQKKEQAPRGNSALADQLAKWMAEQEKT